MMPEKEIKLPKNILKATIVFLYHDVWLEKGSDIRWLISTRRASVFTQDSELAEKLGFRRYDKFEYTKDISLDEIQSARVTVYDDAGEEVVWDKEMPREAFSAWLDSFS